MVVLLFSTLSSMSEYSTCGKSSGRHSRSSAVQGSRPAILGPMWCLSMYSWTCFPTIGTQDSSWNKAFRTRKEVALSNSQTKTPTSSTTMAVFVHLWCYTNISLTIKNEYWISMYLAPKCFMSMSVWLGLQTAMQPNPSSLSAEWLNFTMVLTPQTYKTRNLNCGNWASHI